MKQSIHTRMLRWVFIILANTLLLSSFCLAQTPIEGDDTERAHFEKMADYLTMGSGKWIGENKRYNPNNPRSAKAFGLWFERPMHNLLTIKIVSYLKDTTLISSQGIFSWHPEKGQYIHVTANRGGGFSEGISEFPNDSTFISTMTIYRRNGKVFEHKDENFIVSENVHRNTSFGKDEEDNWVEKGSWIWTREPEQ